MMHPRTESLQAVGTIRELMDWRAEEQPGVDFLVGPETGRRVTFEGLREQARALGGQLQKLGLEPGDKIAFMMDNGLFTAQLFLGAIYSGFVSVPLNVRAGVSQLSYTLDHCDAKVVFVQEKYAATIKEVLASVRHPVQVVDADVDNFPAGVDASAEVELPEVNPDDVALLMYTSGSTGQPKAALHTQGTILAGARNSVLSHELTAEDCSL